MADTKTQLDRARHALVMQQHVAGARATERDQAEALAQQYRLRYHWALQLIEWAAEGLSEAHGNRARSKVIAQALCRALEEDCW